MRISDWSSDVCSSDLPARGADRGGGMTQRLTLGRPDDWHVHLRDGPMLAAVAGYTARQFARAIVMPNLSPPITTAAPAEAYRDRIPIGRESCRERGGQYVSIWVAAGL